MYSVSIPTPLGQLSITVSEEGYLYGIGLSQEAPLPARAMDDGSESRRAPTHGPARGPIHGPIHDRIHNESSWNQLPRENPTLDKVAEKVAGRTIHQLTRYFRSPQWRFDLPLSPAGTPFQQRVWRALRSIPPGGTVSYGMLATQLGTGARAVGNACRENPIPIIIPCHRVVGTRDSGGFMGARAGKPLAIKQWLLRHEAPDGK